MLNTGKKGGIMLKAGKVISFGVAGVAGVFGLTWLVWLLYLIWIMR